MISPRQGCVHPSDLPFMGLMSSSLKKQIIEGKDVNLSTFFIPYYDYDCDKGDREKVKDNVRLKRQLNHSKFTMTFRSKAYEYLKIFSVKSATALEVHWIKVDWAVKDRDLV
ncbi:hypothetical protein KUTeg_008406 [Tegillarca granosa]|uniref:Uncharacterized protein n=1 Tax=Tegillarca granosa TaxID=220873 RepID=A0ABQ9FDX9_TEGGR|nr:hypothetical protein KUTeg_008406 [Tegillarca granosa]